MADSDRMIAALKFLKTKLDPDDWDRCVKILGGTDDGAAMDEPPPFRGMPEPGGKMYQGQAADAAARNRRLATHSAMKRSEAEFFRRFPDAARLRVA